MPDAERILESSIAFQIVHCTTQEGPNNRVVDRMNSWLAPLMLSRDSGFNRCGFDRVLFLRCKKSVRISVNFYYSSGWNQF